MERIDANKGGNVIEVNAKNKRLYFFIPIRGYEPIIEGECWGCDLVYKKTIELQAFILVGEYIGERVRQEPEPDNWFVPRELEPTARNIVGTTPLDEQALGDAYRTMRTWTTNGNN